MLSRWLTTFARALCIACLLGASFARAEAQEPSLDHEVPPPHAVAKGWSPTVFWIAASATIITASLGGFYALHVRDLHDQAQLQPPVSPLRTRLKEDMQTAELTADLLLLGSLALAVGTTVLAFHIDWSGAERARATAAAASPPRRTFW